MLSFLFTCRFKNGDIIQQTQADVSAVDASRSAFYDVLQRIDDVELFTLTNGQHTYQVDLRTGLFEVNGVPFSLHPDEVPESAKLRLIYFHRHQHLSVGGTLGGHTTQYYIGWQTTINGKNYQRTICVKSYS